MEFSKTALVTGGSSGIGRGIALVLAENGYDVALTYGAGKEGAEQTCAAIRALGRKAFMYQAELSQPDVPARIVANAIRDLGHLTLLVNNAGRTIYHSILTLTSEQMEYIYGLNYRAYLLCAGAAARHMVKEGIAGNIIFITSIHGERAYAYDVLYGSLKAAANRACSSIALDLAPYGIRCNCIAPGATKVRGDIEKLSGDPFPDSIPLGRFGSARENGELVAFLADNDKAGYITGITITVDGGLILPGMIEHAEDPSLVHSQTMPEWFDKVKKELAEFKEESPQ